MGAGKNKVHRKNRISKHVLEAQERKKQEEETNKNTQANGTNSETLNNTPATDTDKSTATTTPKKKKQKKNNLIKDPKEVHAYLSGWKHRSTGEGVWKFHKNTQSWIIRNMYDSTKLPKVTFEICMEYLEGLRGEGMRQNIEEDALRRAMRYKTWEKEKQTSSSEEGGGEEADDDDNDESGGKTTDGPNKEQDGDEARWNALDDHDKRKEYKRARKVIEVMKKKPSI